MPLIWPYIVLILLGCGWGLTIPLTVIAVKTGLGHLGIIFWQFFIVMVLFGLRQIFSKKKLAIAKSSLQACCVIAFIGTIFPNSASLIAASYLPGGVLSILIATVGIIIMAFGNHEKNTLIGFVLGIVSALGFSVFSVSLRWRKETPKFTTVALAGLICFLISSAVMISKDLSFFSSSKNEALFAVHGTIVCLGMILYAIASKTIPAAELTLLSLTEVIGGIFWVWLPWLGINEIPGTNTIIGGFFIFLALFYYSLIIKSNRRFIALN